MKFRLNAGAALIFAISVSVSLIAHGQGPARPAAPVAAPAAEAAPPAAAAPARPKAPLEISDAVWAQLEATEAYRNLPQPKPVKVEFQSTEEVSGPVARLMATTTFQWRTVVDITPVSDKCTRRRVETFSGPSRRVVDHYACGFAPLGMIGDGGMRFMQLERVESVEGSLFPMRVGNRQKSILITRGRMTGDKRLSSDCEVMSQLQAQEVDSRLSGAAWKVRCTASQTPPELNKGGESEDYYLEDLAVFLSVIGQYDRGRNSSVLPSAGSQTAADTHNKSLVTTTYSTYGWSDGSVAVAAGPQPSPASERPTVDELRDAKRLEEARNMTPEQAEFARQQQRMQQELSQLREQLAQRQAQREAQERAQLAAQQQAQQQAASSGPGLFGGLLGGVASRVLDNGIAKVNAAAGGTGAVGSVIADANSRIATAAKDRIAEDMGSTHAGRTGMNLAGALTAGSVTGPSGAAGGLQAAAPTSLGASSGGAGCNYPDKISAAERQQAQRCGVQFSSHFSVADSGLASVISACKVGEKAKADAYYAGTYQKMVDYARSVSRGANCGVAEVPGAVEYYSLCTQANMSQGKPHHQFICHGPQKQGEGSCGSWVESRYKFLRQVPGPGNSPCSEAGVAYTRSMNGR